MAQYRRVSLMGHIFCLHLLSHLAATVSLHPFIPHPLHPTFSYCQLTAKTVCTSFGR